MWTWSQQAYIKASNAGQDDGFGQSLVLSGNSLLVGAAGEDSGATGINGDQGNSPSGVNSGAAYVFARDGTFWSQQAYLKASNSDAEDIFGTSVALDGDTMVVGASAEDSDAMGIDADESNNNASAAGAAYLYSRVGNLWYQNSYIKASNTSPSDQFGRSVAVSGTMVVVGSSLEDSDATGVNGTHCSDSLENAGAAYVFDSAEPSVGGQVSGLIGAGLVLQNNNGDNLSICQSGEFHFRRPLADSTEYSVTVLTQPTGPSQTCNVLNGSGTLAGADVTNVSVTCMTDTFTVGGSASGLVGSGLILQNNTADDLSITTDGSFTFVTPLDDGSGYSITVLHQPTSPTQTCTVSNGSGVLAGANITTVQIGCLPMPENIFLDGFEDQAP